MAIDIATARRRLKKAQEDVTFYEGLVRLLSDPRLAEDVPQTMPLDLGPTAKPDFEMVKPSGDVVGSIVPRPAKRSPHGEVRRKVLEALPAKGSIPLNTGQILEAIQATGYVFLSRNPLMAINDALGELSTTGEALLADRRGVYNFWTRGEAANPWLRG